MKVIRTAALVAAAAAAFTKAKAYARENPGQASDTIDKAESFVRGRTAPKYADKVGKGSQALRKSLGLPGGTGAPTTSSTAQSPTTPTSVATDGSGPDSAPEAFDPAI